MIRNPRLCDIESRALRLGYCVDRYQTFIDVGHVGVDHPAAFARWRATVDGAVLDGRGDLTSGEVREIEEGAASVVPSLVTVLTAMLCAAGGADIRLAVATGEALADELRERGHLDALDT